MQLKEFSLISPVVESGAVLKALETAIPSVAIEQALGKTHSNELVVKSLNVPGCRTCSNFPFTIKQYLHTSYSASGCSKISTFTTRRNTFFLTWLVREIRR